MRATDPKAKVWFPVVRQMNVVGLVKLDLVPIDRREPFLERYQSIREHANFGR
jgi:hypothetical protein